MLSFCVLGGRREEKKQSCGGFFLAWQPLSVHYSDLWRHDGRLCVSLGWHSASHHAAGRGRIGRKEEREWDAPDGPGCSCESHTYVIHTNGNNDEGLKTSCGCDSVVSSCLLLIVGLFFVLFFLCCTNLIHMVARYFFRGWNKKNFAPFFSPPLDPTKPPSHCVNMAD